MFRVICYNCYRKSVENLKYSTISKSEADTKALAGRIAKHLFRGSLITLEGPLGSGKTTFVAGIARELGIKDRIISPTFNILKCYFEAEIPMFHIDAYRLENRDSELGLEEFIEGSGVTLIEWPAYIAALIPHDCLRITIENLGDSNRRFTFESRGERYDAMLKKSEEREDV